MTENMNIDIFDNKTIWHFEELGLLARLRIALNLILGVKTEVIGHPVMNFKSDQMIVIKK